MLAAIVTGTAYATDPLVERAIQEAQKKYPPGDYDKGFREINTFQRSRTVTIPALLEIHVVAASRDATKKWYTLTLPDGGSEVVFLEPDVLLDRTALKSAWLEHDSSGTPQIHLALTDEGAKKFAEITGKYIGKRIGILVRDRLVSAPIIRDQIFGGSLVIGGRLSEIEAAEIATKLNSSGAE